MILFYTYLLINLITYLIIYSKKLIKLRHLYTTNMEEFQKYRELAAKNIKVADHILNVTYSLVEDTKLLLGVAESILMALTNTMYSLVSYERLFRRLPPYQENFESKYNMFRLKIVPRYNINKSHILFIEKMRDIIKKHKESPIEFVRKDKFVICSEGWKVEALSIRQLREFIDKTKEFFDYVYKITSKHETIFK